MESYQTLNRELVLTVRDLRKENVELRALVTSLTAENMRISSEYSEFRRCATDKFAKISEILGSVAQDLFPEASKKPTQEEMTRKRYTMMSESATASSSLPRSSPEKMPRKTATAHVNVGRRRGGQKARETAAAVPEDTDDFDTSDMSIEDIRDWLKSDQIEIAAPVTEDPVEKEPIEEEADTSEEVPENQEQIYKNMTTILEENSKSISHSSLQVTQITRFAASTPHSTRCVATEASRMELSPITSSGGDQRCLLVNGEKREKIFARQSPEVSGETSVTLVLPKSVTVRRREKFVRELTPEESEEPKEPSPAKSKEEPEEPTPPRQKKEPKSKTGKKRTQRKRLADVTNWTENSPEELPKPTKVEKLDDDIPPRSQRPRRQAAPKNLAEPRLLEKLRRE